MQYLLFAEFKQVFPDSRDPLSDFQVLKMEHNERIKLQKGNLAFTMATKMMINEDMNRTKDRITSINKNIANQPRGIFWPAGTKSGRKKEKKLIVW